MNKLDLISTPIQDELKLFTEKFGNSIRSDIPLLNIITNYLLRRKGKQIRPLLVFLTAKLNGTISESTFSAASLVELLHTATLIHDDVVDESYERRGFLSINAIWKSKISVLLGDYLLSRGMLLAVNHQEYDILNIVSDAVREMSEGELLQIQKSRKLDLSEEDYFKIIRKKTATLIAACAASGARSVTKDDTLIGQMKEFGLKLGIAFQIKDDLFDYERTALTGKPKGNDIQEKKLTLPLIAALSSARYIERREIIHLINRKSSNKDTYDRVFKFVHEHQGMEYAQKIMSQYHSEAKSILQLYPDSDVRKALENLTDYIVERNG
jgi:octaprenyl-diphosphate synthase